MIVVMVIVCAANKVAKKESEVVVMNDGWI
jgi:hypothetical protein